MNDMNLKEARPAVRFWKQKKIQVLPVLFQQLQAVSVGVVGRGVRVWEGASCHLPPAPATPRKHQKIDRKYHNSFRTFQNNKKMLRIAKKKLACLCQDSNLGFHGIAYLPQRGALTT